MAQQRFHHRHLPTLTRWTTVVSWKMSHLFFPTIIHFLTDKYHGRTHHLVVDTIYSVITVVFIAVNIGLGAWFYLYFTPAQLDVRVFTTTHVESGQEMPIAFQYLSPNRAVQDAEIGVLLPPGFIRADNGTREPITFTLGDLERFDTGVVELQGTVFGSVGTDYEIRAITSYTSLGRRHFETTVHQFTVTDSPFNVTVELPDVVAFGTPVTATVRYTNNSDVDRTNVKLHFELPQYFTVNDVSSETQQYYFDSTTSTVQIPDVPAHTEGSIAMNGTFVTPSTADTIGDQQQVFAVEAESSGRTAEADILDVFTHGTVYASVDVITPRIEATIDGDDVLNFGETVHVTVTVTNIGDRPLQQVTPTATVEGSPALISNASATDENENTTTTDGDTLTFPTIATLDAGTSHTYTVTIPTTVVNGEQLTTTLHITGTAFSPDINTTLTIPEQEWETKYNSQVELSTDVLYTTEEGEQIGYGPYPPQPWEVTAMRVILSVRNNNNPLSNVRIRTVMPSQSEWSNIASVSAGTSIEYNNTTREVEWVIPKLDPQQTAYGAQFEIRFTPNHLQVGLQPHLLEPAAISAADAFTGTILSQTAPAVLLPVPVATAD